MKYSLFVGVCECIDGEEGILRSAGKLKASFTQLSRGFLSIYFTDIRNIPYSLLKRHQK